MVVSSYGWVGILQNIERTRTTGWVAKYLAPVFQARF